MYVGNIFLFASVSIRVFLASFVEILIWHDEIQLLQQ